MDPSAAPIPNAKVTLTSNETGENRTVTSDDEGRYSFPLLKIGSYNVTVETQGFQKTVANAEVRSAEITSLNLKLEVGQVTESIVVSDAASPLDTQSAQLSGTFNSKQVTEIPVTRNPNLLATTLPGMIPAPGGANTGSFISHGNRMRANNITIDNITATDISVAGTGSTNNGPLNFSSIKEVKIITNTFSAEFGRNSGSQLQFITKSGTNSLHGEVYEYLRNDAFNARDWFDRTTRPTFIRYNQYGGVIGGPVIRNKTHFFASGENQVQKGSGAARIAQVPTAAMLARVTDPTSRALLDQYKLPSATAEFETFGNVQQNAVTSNSQYQYSIRLDHQISERDTIYGRFGTSHNEGGSTANTFIETNIANFGLRSTNTPYSVNLNETHIFGPTVVNEFRAGFGRTSPIFVLDTNVTPGPRIIFSNGQIDRFGHTDLGPQGRVQNTFQYGDTVTWTKGAHTVKAGGDFYRYQGNSSLDSQVRGVYTFLNWDDFALGRPNAYAQRFGNTVRGHRTWLQGSFVQDDFRLTPALTLNLGLRFESFGPVTEVNGYTTNLDFNCRDSIGRAGAGAFGCFELGQPAGKTNHYFQPRIGFAWNPGHGKTVIRGGYGLVADFNFLNPITNTRALPPLVITQSMTGVANFTGANSWANLYAGTAAIQREGASLVGQIRTDVLNFGDFNPVIDANLQNPQVHQFSIGIQRELPQNIVLKIGYVGTKANYLQRSRQVNLNAAMPAPATSLADEAARTQEFLNSYNNLTGSATRQSSRIDPRFNVVNLYDNSANSNYHSLEVFATRSFRSFYSVQAAYTYSKSLDDVSDGLTALPNDSSLIQDPRNLAQNRGVSAYDLPHRFVMVHVIEMPWGNRFGNALARKVLGGWGISGISSWRTGFPVSFEAGPRLAVANISTVITAGIIRPNAAGPFEFNPVPAGSPGAPQGLNSDPVAGRRISAYAESLGLSQPLLGNFGTLGRNTHRLGGETNFDWNLYKTTSITESIRLQLRCEVYNVFNNHSFRDVTRSISNAAFGQYTSPNQSQRFLQLGARVEF